MSGWQRLGVVISVLWLLGAPIYFIGDTNATANRVYSMCLSHEWSLTGRTDYKVAEAKCLPIFDELGMSVPKLLNTLFTESNEPRMGSGWPGRAALWGMLLIPLVIFWLLGGLISRTVRWVARGFQHSKA